jgi:rhamnose utilization protein RhaD (predicted bifunctional aldolase and dehydrogenase)
MLGAQPSLLPAHKGSEVASLIDLSARLGKDPLLVQASNGNTSIKLDGSLWIKSSGKWLANAGREELLVPIPLKVVRESIRNNTEIAAVKIGEKQMMPSIETAMHAVLSHRVVIHVHSVNTIAWAIRRDGMVQLKERLGGLSWLWIPYVGSGIPLAREIEKRLADAPETDVLVLGNHGLVVCGADCDAAETLLNEVERRLVISQRQSPGADSATLAAIARRSQWRIPDLDSLHALGTDAVSRNILRGGILFPCQAIFLGLTMPLMPKAVLFSDFQGGLDDRGKTPSFVVVEESGVLVNENMTNTEFANLMGLLQVIQRTEESTPIRYLTITELSSVLSHRAYSYKASAMRSEKVGNQVPSF